MDSSNQNECVNEIKPPFTILHVKTLNEAPVAQIEEFITSEFLCKVEKDDCDGDVQSQDKNIKEPLSVEASCSSDHHETNNNENDNESIQMGETAAPELLMEMDIETESMCSSSSDASLMLMKDLSAFNQTIFDESFFELNIPKSKKKRKNQELFARCKLCKRKTEIRGRARTISSFRTHLHKDHGDAIVDELLKHILLKKSRLIEHNDEIKSLLRKHNDEIRKLQSNQMSMPSPTPSAASTPSKKASIGEASTSPTVGAISINKQMLFNAKVLNYVLRSFTPLSSIDSPEFLAMFNHFGINMPPINKEHLAKQIEIKCNMIKNKIITLLEGVDFVCICTDLWTSNVHYYVAITCHWIDAVTFKRKSVALACKRFESYSGLLLIEEQLNETLKSYNLPKDKVTANVTHNCYNFSKLFKDLNIPTMDKNDTINENNIVPFKTMDLLPYTCYTKTLSLIATIDVPNAIYTYPKLRHIHDLTMKKVFLFLKLASTNDKLGPILTDLKKPDMVKWNSIYDSIAYFLKLEQKHSFAELFGMLKIDPFTRDEENHLREYIKCLEPLATAFERLQDEQGTYHGFILPSLLELRKKCEKLMEIKGPSTYRPILNAILLKTLKRFEQLFQTSPQADRATISSLSHPFFKENWVSAIEGVQKETVRELLIETLKQENPESNIEIIDLDEEDKCEQQMDDFYFGEDQPKQSKTVARSEAEKEALKYLRDDRRNLKMLDDYPAVKRVFFKYNTSLSSSAAVEKIFPYETRLNIARYGCLADELFEERVLYIVNKDVLVS